METNPENRLLKIARKLRDLAQDIEDLALSLAEHKDPKPIRTRARDINIDGALVERLRGVGRLEAKQELVSLNHKQLGAINRAIGGSSEEGKKTKDMIIERILYRLFDYSAGHKLLKGAGESTEKDQPTKV